MTELLHIDRMGFGSESIAKAASGKTVFVEGGAPGDVVVAEIVEEKSSFSRARIVGIERASDHRVAPACPQSATCGGCPWQHLSYEAQLAAKRENVVGALVHTAHVSPDDAERIVKAPAPSKRTWGYRNKIELGTSLANGALEVGFFSEGTHDLVYTQSCPAAVKPLEKAPKALRGALRFAQGSGDLGIFRIGVRASVRTRDLEVALWTAPGAFPRAHVAKTLGSALKATSIVRVMADPGKARKIKGVEALFGKGCWSEDLAGNSFMTSAPSFFQVNTAQAEKLIAAALDGLGDIEGKYVADLYAGGGTFSIPLAKAGADVVAIESCASSVRDLRRNADANDVDVDVVGGDAAHELSELGSLDALLVDPPRAGLANGVVADIAAAAPERVAYISCNPTTWARDAQRFGEAGYELVSAQPVDMFPQTPHIEVASVFAKRSAH